MKKYMILSTLMLLVMTMPLMVACGEDSDEGSESTSAGVLDSNSGLRVKKVGSVTYYYNDKRQLDYLLDGSNNKYVFSNYPNRIVHTYRGSDEEGEGVIALNYNNAGFVTSVKNTGNGHDGDVSGSTDSNTSISYDSSGHIKESSGSGKESGTYSDGSPYSSKWSFKYKFTWNNNLLSQIDYLFEIIYEDGYIENTTETWIYTYADNQNDNVYCQWAPSFELALEADIVFYYVGLFGKGPNALPISAKQHCDEYYDGKQHSTDNSYTYRYGFNSNGSISYNYVNNTRFDFSYDSTDTVDSTGTDDKVADSTVCVYEWIMSNTSITNGTAAEKQAAINAEKAVNAIIVKSFQILGSVNSDKHTLTIVGGDENANDNKVKASYYAAANDISVAASTLPNNACITIKRGDKKIFDNVKLK